jgi:mRNA interferase MazF
MLRSEVWLINLDPTIGAEIRKIRPVVIVNNNSVGKLPLKVVVPVTDWKEPYAFVRWMVRIDPDNQNGLNKISAVDTFQVRSVSQERFIQQLGRLSEERMQAVTRALAFVLNITS